MKELCRICARELCGNQRRWIFHPAAKLQVLLSHALDHDLRRDGRREFVCSKCAFMLERMYRFDTVIARVEALSIERLHKLLVEKDHLRQCIRRAYRKHNDDVISVQKDCMVDLSNLHDAKYCALLEQDLMYSAYESWAEDEEQTFECVHYSQFGSEVSWHKPRRCRGCSMLRVADSDYEAVCKVPRKVVRSTSCGPSTRYSETTMTTTASATLVPENQSGARASSDSDKTLGGRQSSSNSEESLISTMATTPVAEEVDRDGREERNSDTLSEGPIMVSNKLQLALCLVQNCGYKPVQIPHGSKLPVLIKSGSLDSSTKLGSPGQTPITPTYGTDCTLEMEETPKIQLDLVTELAELEELWNDIYMEYPPISFKKKKNLIEEQQSQLNHYESAAGQCVNELQKAQLQVQSLQDKIQESETSNKKLQESLSEMETELRSIKQAAQHQDRTIQNLTETLHTKESEAQELYQVIEGQNSTLCKLRDMAHRSQIQNTQAVNGGELQSEVVALQSSLFSCQLELEAFQRADRQSQRVVEDLTHAQERLRSDLEAAWQHREATEKYNQELRNAMQQLRSELQVKEAQLKESEDDKQYEILTRDKTISQMQLSLKEKERLVQEYSELLEQPAEPGRNDALLNKLKNRIRDRDKALERSIDEKFRCLEEKESEVRKLQLALREKERDLERLRCILSNNEETIMNLDGLVRSRDLELEQTKEGGRKLQWLKQQCDEKHSVELQERDSIITQLHTRLHAHSKETEDLTAALMAKLSPSPNEVVEGLKSRLVLKERLFQELLSERSRQTQDHHTLIQDLLNSISSRDQYIKESGERLRLVIVEQTGQLQELRRQLTSREHELNEVSRDREREKERGAPLALEMRRLQNMLNEKEILLQDLMRSQEETSTTKALREVSGDNSALEMQAVKEELQIALRKHRETERELMELKSALTKTDTDHLNHDPQLALEQLITEYQQLNQALRAEKKVYQNLSHAQARGDSSVEKTRALHTELDTVQALRGQLEEVLSRTRDTALALDRAAKAQADYGGGLQQSLGCTLHKASGPAGGAVSNTV